MPERAQSAASHHRLHPPFHLFLIPVLITNLIIAVVCLVRIPGLLTGWLVILSSALLLMGVTPSLKNFAGALLLPCQPNPETPPDPSFVKTPATSVLLKMLYWSAAG